MNAPLMDLKLTVDPVGQSANKKRSEMTDSDFSRYVSDQPKDDISGDTQEDLVTSPPDNAVGMCVVPVARPPAVVAVAPETAAVVAGATDASPVLSSAEPAIAAVPQGGAAARTPDLNTVSTQTSEGVNLSSSEAADQAGGGLMGDGIDITLAAVSGKTDSTKTESTGDKADADGTKATDSLDTAVAGDATADNADMSSDDGRADDSGANKSGDVQETAKADAPQGDTRRTFTADVQALYGATSTLNARHGVTPGIMMADPAQLAQQASQQMAHAMQSSRDGTVELALSPDELGHVKLVLHSDDGKLHVTIQAERPETQDLLRRHLDGLERDFRAAGYSDVAFSFDGQGQGQQPRQLVNDLNIGGEAETDRSNTPVPVAMAPRGTAGGLDLRI